MSYYTSLANITNTCYRYGVPYRINWGNHQVLINEEWWYIPRTGRYKRKGTPSRSWDGCLSPVKFLKDKNLVKGPPLPRKKCEKCESMYRPEWWTDKCYQEFETNLCRPCYYSLRRGTDEENTGG